MPAVSAYCVKCKGKKETKILGVLVVGNRYSVKGTCPTCESKQCVFVKKELGDEIGKEYKFLEAPSVSKETSSKKAVNDSKEEKPKKTKKTKKEPEPEHESEHEEEEEKPKKTKKAKKEPEHEEEEEKPKKKGERKAEKKSEKRKKGTRGVHKSK